MYWLSLAIFCLALGALVLRRQRKRELVVAGLVGMVSSGLLSVIPISSTCQLTDTGPVSEHWALLLLSQVSVAPVMSAWYAQELEPCKPLPLGRTTLFVVLSSSLAWMALSAERITCPLPIAPYLIAGHSVLNHLLIWKALNFVYACGSPDRKGDRSVRVR